MTDVADFNIADVSEVYIQRNPDGTFRVMWESLLGSTYQMGGLIPRAKVKIDVIALSEDK